MTLKEFAARANLFLLAGADSRGLSVQHPIVSEDSITWEVDTEGISGTLSTNGEVYDLVLSKKWYLHAFEYDGSLEIISQLLDVFIEYTRGNYAQESTLFGQQVVRIETSGEEWTGRLLSRGTN